MTATSARFAPEYMTEAVAALLSGVEAGRREIMPVLADALEDAGYADAADLAALRAGTFQATEEWAEVVTVARRGADTARCGNGISVPIHITAVYRAVRRADGVLTWRRVGSIGYGTAGQEITRPMRDAAQAAAADRGVPYVARVRHGMRCH